MAASIATAQARKTAHLAPLDGLRGIAIILVAWYHVWEMTWLAADIHVGPFVANFNVFPETGSAGVDLFYFISGFCLFYPYARTLFDGAPLQSIASFTYRRVLKIVPSYYLAIFLLIVCGLAQFGSTADELRQVVAHLTFTQNIWDETWGGIDGVMWSLATEVQFYVLFPLICWCAMRRPLPTFVSLLAIGLMYRAVVVNHVDVVHEIDRLPGAIDLFASGMFSAWAYRAIAVRFPKLASDRRLWLAVAIFGLGACYGLLRWEFLHRYDGNWNFAWKATLRPGLDLLLIPLTLGSLFTFSAWQRVLGNPLFLFLSYISYNLYLWHQPIAKLLLDHASVPVAGSDPHRDPVWGLGFTILAFVSAIAVAWGITAVVEQPLLRRKPFVRFFTQKRLRTNAINERILSDPL